MYETKGRDRFYYIHEIIHETLYLALSNCISEYISSNIHASQVSDYATGPKAGLFNFAAQ